MRGRQVLYHTVVHCGYLAGGLGTPAQHRQEVLYAYHKCYATQTFRPMSTTAGFLLRPEKMVQAESSTAAARKALNANMNGASQDYELPW